MDCSAAKPFDTNRAHIHLECSVTNNNGYTFNFNAILDSGAPVTEFSDLFLLYADIWSQRDDEVSLKPGLQTQKYDKTTIPLIEIANQQLLEFEVYVSSFESSWGIDALIGLDFFRLFEVTIDYSKGQLLAKPFSHR